MSTLDKINSELSSLQQELSQLNHYTQEIGKAKDASSAVVKMSKDFLTSFQKRVEEINKEMAKAASDFTNRCNDSSKTLASANQSFQKGISEAQNTLVELGVELSIVAEKVNELATKIEAINILGHFERIHSAFVENSTNQNSKFSDLNNSIQSYANETRVSSKENKVLLIVTLVCLAILVVLSSYILFKITK